MNILGVLGSDASWWQAHMALPEIVRRYRGRYDLKDAEKRRNSFLSSGKARSGAKLNDAT